MNTCFSAHMQSAKMISCWRNLNQHQFFQTTNSICISASILKRCARKVLKVFTCFIAPARPWMFLVLYLLVGGFERTILYPQVTLNKEIESLVNLTCMFWVVGGSWRKKTCWEYGNQFQTRNLVCWKPPRKNLFIVLHLNIIKGTVTYQSLPVIICYLTLHLKILFSKRVF